MAQLYNGFTGRPIDDPDFESAGAASRRLRNVASGEEAGRRDERPRDDQLHDNQRRDVQRRGGGRYDAGSVSAAFAEAAVATAQFATTAANAATAAVDQLQYARDWGQAKTDAAREFDYAALDAMPAPDKRWAWAEVDLAAIRHNVSEVRRALDPRCRMMAVVKADGYGHGAVEVANAALAAGAEQLAASTVAEGVELRRAGITAPIVILDQPPVTSVPVLLAYQITPAVYDTEFAIAYGEAADLHGVVAPFHLALNTGMNRVGADWRDAVEFVQAVSFHRSLRMDGVFTHFATAESRETLDFEIQARRFEEALEQMNMAGIDLGVVHAANSAAAMRFPQVHYNMVRCGIALYGIHPCDATRNRFDLHPALSVHARIIDARKVTMSEGVSYGYVYRSPGNVKICTLPIGYADGLRRNLSGRIDFIMDGRYFRQVGAICMDQCMFEIDLRDRANQGRFDARVGDEVLVVGRAGVAEVTVEELADKANTIPQEILADFGMRLPRVYV